jgi:hypothetical protein
LAVLPAADNVAGLSVVVSVPVFAASPTATSVAGPSVDATVPVLVVLPAATSVAGASVDAKSLELASANAAYAPEDHGLPNVTPTLSVENE